MAGKNSSRDEVEDHNLIETEEKNSLVGNDLPGGIVTDTAQERTVQRLSPISEINSGEVKGDTGPTGSSFSLCSVDVYSSGSSSTSNISEDTEDACAGIVLNCLFCHFYDMCIMLPAMCERAANHICPSYKYFSAPLEPVHSSDWNCHCDFDCGLFDACHETGECLELAMEISEICYR